LIGRQILVPAERFLYWLSSHDLSMPKLDGHRLSKVVFPRNVELPSVGYKSLVGRHTVGYKSLTGRHTAGSTMRSLRDKRQTFLLVWHFTDSNWRNSPPVRSKYTTVLHKWWPAKSSQHYGLLSYG